MAMASNMSNGGFPSSSFERDPTEKPTKTIRVDRDHVVFPAQSSQRHQINLSPFDVPILLCHYDQKGILYEMPAHGFSSAVTVLKNGLSQTLVSFYPLAGRLATSVSDGEIYIDCNDAGATLIEASAENVGIADVMAAEVTKTVDQLFALNCAVNIEGRHLPLLVVQVTKLHDGIFVACSLNHAIGDGGALWHFFNSWAEICRGGGQEISLNPSFDRSWIPSSVNRSLLCLNLDCNSTDIKRFCPPRIRIKFFHFTKEIMNGLKDRANSGRDSQRRISSLQALCGHVWQAITRARGLGHQDPTTFGLAVDCRSRLVPPSPSGYFGNAVQGITTTAMAWEVVRNELSFPAQLVHGIIQSHGDTSIKGRLDAWEKNPTLLTLDDLGNSLTNRLQLGSSPRFRMYETDFGWGKPVAVRSGCGNKIDGKLHVYPGREQEGSVDLEICLASKAMNALEIDQHFLNPLLSESK